MKKHLANVTKDSVATGAFSFLTSRIFRGWCCHLRDNGLAVSNPRYSLYVSSVAILASEDERRTLI